MASEIKNEWPLLAIAIPGQHALQARAALQPPSQDMRRSVAKLEKVELESDIRGEKGLFIDIYA
jgi:hypothetical protein